MNMNSAVHQDAQAALSQPEALLHRSSSLLRGHVDRLRPLHAALRDVIALGDTKTQKAARRLMSDLANVEPSVTMIGQIKSGKTSLVNALIGQQDLLPADVNPWTSVVTSLHLSAKPLTPQTSAQFQFFDRREWDRLVSGGGRIGELANRAGADDEISKIRAQVEMMREKSKARLGRKFEALLGTQHSYGYFDKELIERYVCLGDDFEDDSQTAQTRGRFADITCSADLYMQQRGYPVNICVRDTPGVNDTFMIREQITIKSIRDSRLCVVVLSAHQALSSTDLALIRMISNVKSREVIIFVNRIDELSEPKVQVSQIEKSILKTLEQNSGPADATLIFGSALWAQSSMQGKMTDMAQASLDALLDWAEVAQLNDADTSDPHALMWELSGLPALIGALSERMIDGELHEIARQASITGINLIQRVQVGDNLAAKASVGDTVLCMQRDDILRELEGIRARHLAQFGATLDGFAAAFGQRVKQSHANFLSRATDALAKHLEHFGEQSTWTYDPTGLRVLLGSAYKIFGAKCQKAFQEEAVSAVADIGGLFNRALDLPSAYFDPSIPDVPRVVPPVTLGQTIALDLQGSWWKSWWTRRQSYEAQAQKFYDLIKAETDSLTSDLTGDQAVVLQQDIMQVFEGFLSEQIAGLAELTGRQAVSDETVGAFLGVDALQERHQTLARARLALERYVA